ncbi:MAG: ATP-binding protein [Cyanobacteria bacterium P01_E01_bin.6]
MTELMTFDQQIQMAQGRLNDIQQRAERAHADRDPLLAEAIAELAISLEELHVASEEINEKNTILLDTRQDLAWERQRYQNLFDFAPDAYIVTDEYGVIQDANQAAESLFNMRHDFLVGKSLPQFIANADRSFIYRQLEHVARLSAPSTPVEKEYSKPHSVVAIPSWNTLFVQNQEVLLQPRDQETSCSASFSLSGDYTVPGTWVLSWIFRDLRETKQTQALLKQQNEELILMARSQNAFLAAMSHELRTPLNVILGMTEALQEDVYGAIADSQRSPLQTIESRGFHLLTLINDILDVAQIESGQMALEISPRAIAPLCQASVASVQEQAQNKNLQLDMTLPDVLPDVPIDERRISQVLSHLLSNAIKFTPEGGHITLEVSHLQTNTDTDACDTDAHVTNASSLHDCVRISVIDTGIGMAPEDIDLLFQPFIQGDRALSRKYDGAGLGLALVKYIVELHGGQVTITSQVGVGSCFTVDLPLE